jgi:hypothetical protein
MVTGRPRSCSCDECPKCKHRIYMRNYYYANGRKTYSNKNDDEKLVSRRKQTYAKYGMTEDDYNEMYVKQRGVCAVCFKPETCLSNNGKIKRLAVDHDHETGEVRGLLCNNCNRAIGLLGDDLDILQSAIDYLDRQVF